MLAQGSAWLDRQMSSFAAQEVSYLRGEASVEVRATVGRSVHDQTESDGLVVRVSSRDFLINACDLVLDDVQIEPAPGDRIVQGGEDGHVYEVMPGTGIPAWEWSDLHHRRRRIHTKYVGRAPLEDDE